MQKHDIKIALQNFVNICRVCLEQSDELQSIYGVFVDSLDDMNTGQIDLVKIFRQFCNVEVNPTDEKPQHVCKPCATQFCTSYLFFDRCSQSDNILEQVLLENKVDILEAVEVKNEVFKTDDEEKNAKTISQTEKTPYLIESEDDHFVIDQDDSSDWEPPKDDLKEDLSLKLKNECHKIEEGQGIKLDSSDEEVNNKTEKQKNRRRKRPLPNQVPRRRGRPRKTRAVATKNDREDSEAIENQHKELICRLCNETFPDINTSIDHYDEAHAPKLEVDECIFCDRPKVYKKRDNLLYHMSLHSEDSIKCVPCRKYFRTKELLTEHLKECFRVDRKTADKIEESLEESTKADKLTNQSLNTQLSQKVLKLTQFDGAFSCQLCNKHLGEIDLVISHFEKEHLNDLFCIVCMRTFSKQVPLFHIGLHSKKSHLCRPCRLFFKTKEDYDEHCSKYDHDKSLSCKICGKEFTRNYKKNKHMLSHLKEKNYSCNKCGKTFTYKTSLARHFKMHFGKRFLCSSCGNAYTTKFMLQRHIRIMHTFVDEDGKPLPKPPPKPVKLQCEFCGEIFTTKYGYGRHIRRHPEFREFKCKICSFMCDTKDQLDVHMEGKHNKHTCDVCGKRFPFESELKTHHRKHEDMEMARFRCDVCGKTARTQTQLKVHYRIHTGERPFSCEVCGTSFKQTAHLKVHMFQHTGKMPFKCEICQKSFPFQHVMEIHMRTHTGEKPFQCMFCGKAYHDRTTMQKHQKKKHPEMPIQKTNRGEYKIANFLNVSQ